jgi:hypothetical protein
LGKGVVIAAVRRTAHAAASAGIAMQTALFEGFEVQFRRAFALVVNGAGEFE